ncbi:MAG: 30S ribosomal protein S12 methylthiotransferase RimO [Erysipelotrichaceae bacterium]|nr:30S ribosomal protein S12 methylthiotransferase RimO [Erysipelotrichaceae bacterium]
MKKVGLVSLGCAKNLVDSEMILGLLEKDKYLLTNDPKDADIIIVNTCAFIEDSKKEAIQTIFDMLSYKNAKLVVVGCLAERYQEILKKEIPEISLFIPIRDYPHFNDLLGTLDKDLNICGGLDYHSRLLSTKPFTAYLRISDGCDNRCSYCAIPLIRGKFKSRPMKEIIDEAHILSAKGVKELVVISQDTTKYGIDLPHREKVEDLLKELLKIKQFEYIRLLYLYPDEISDELIELFGKEKRLTPYFDIPIQHSESSILKRMNRRGDKTLLMNLFNKIKNRVPSAVLRTTVMLGFPGESKEDVDGLIKFMEDVKFDHLGSFTYSKEDDTPAFKFTDQISEEEKKARLDLVMKTQKKISYQKNKTHIGEVMEGLIVGKKGNQYLLRSYWNAPDDVDGNIYVNSEIELKEGQKVKVKITDAFVYDLMGNYVVDISL